MRRFLYISERDTSRILNAKTANRLIRQSFLELGQKGIQMPPKVYLNLPYGDFRAMPVSTPRSAGIKWISVYPRNKGRGIPTVMGTILLNDTRTGRLLAVIEANTLTAFRTGAAGAVASQCLARPDAATLLLVGAGVQSEYQLLCHAPVFRLKRVIVWSPSVSEMRQFVKRLQPKYPQVEGETLLRRAVRRADIIATCTPSRKPLIKHDWLKTGVHINAMGADAPGKQELDPAVLKRGAVYVDDRAQASHSGEINVPLKSGFLSQKNIQGTLTDALTRKPLSRPFHNKITVFDSTGLATQDIALARYLYEAKVKERS